MKTLDEILSDLSTMRDELASMDIKPSYFQRISTQINQIEKDLDKLNREPENLLDSVRWVNLQERDFFVETSHTLIGDFGKALEMGLKYHITQLKYGDGEPYEWLLGMYLSELYWEAKDEIGENCKVDICALVLDKALKKAQEELPDSLALQNAYVDANGLASTIQLQTSVDYDNINDEIKQIIKDKGIEWFRENVSDVSKAVLINDFNIDVDKLLNKEQKIICER